MDHAMSAACSASSPRLRGLEPRLLCALRAAAPRPGVAGIAAADRGRAIITRRDLGLVSQALNANDLITLGGELAIGHVRYSTTGSNAWENSQPVQRAAGAAGNRRELALAHNGNLINAVELHARLRAEGVSFASTSDSEIIAALIASHPAERIEDAAAAVMPDLLGAFSTVLMTKDRVLAMRDPLGLRPLAIGRLAPLAQGGPPRYCIASETCAHDILGRDSCVTCVPARSSCSTTKACTASR